MKNYQCDNKLRKENGSEKNSDLNNQAENEWGSQ